MYWAYIIYKKKAFLLYAVCVFNIKASTYEGALQTCLDSWKEYKKYLKGLSNEIDLAFDEMYG